LKLVVSPAARRSLARTIRLLARTHSKDYLVRLKREVDQQVKQLPIRPLAGALEPELEHLGAGHRRVIVGPFRIIYRLTANAVYVTDIFDPRRDPKRMKG
jgi:plasmid stabilization system protein ParE